MTSPSRRLRVLCLHGMGTNAAVMKDQTKALREALGNDAEFIFLEGKFEARWRSDEAIERRYAHTKPFLEWVYASKLKPSDAAYSPDEKHWSWTYKRLDECLEHIHAKLHEIGPVDVAVGFSQGAIVMTHLSMLYSQRHANPTRWWKLCVCVGGGAVRGIQLRSLFETSSGGRIRVPVPSIHIIGKSDPIYQDSLELVEQYDDFPPTASQALTKRVFYHDAGHRFPSAKDQNLYQEVARLVRAHCEKEEAASTVSRL